MTIYAIIQDYKYVVLKELRETKMYFIDDSSGVRYRKKSYINDGAIATHSSRRSTFRVLPQDLPEVKRIQTEQAKSDYSLKVKNRLLKICGAIRDMNFDEVQSLAKSLGMEDFKQ